MSSELDRAYALIRAQVARSQVPEDPGHAENTLEWLLRLEPEADQALRLAALAHDIERSRPNRLRRQEFEDYDRFKAMHAAIGARMAGRRLCEAGVPHPNHHSDCQPVLLHDYE